MAVSADMLPSEVAQVAMIELKAMGFPITEGHFIQLQHYVNEAYELMLSSSGYDPQQWARSSAAVAARAYAASMFMGGDARAAAKLQEWELKSTEWSRLAAKEYRKKEAADAAASDTSTTT